MKQLFAFGNISNNDVLGFDSKLLFWGTEIIAPILTHFDNASLTNKIVISDWKVSKVTPIYKGKGNKEEAGNYRLISLIGHIMKIFEKEIKTQLMVYLEINDLIAIDQSAYSCSTIDVSELRLIDTLSRVESQWKIQSQASSVLFLH